MKQPYRWDYTIKVRTKEGTYEYEDKLENIGKIINEHPVYEEFTAKKLVKRRNNGTREFKKSN